MKRATKERILETVKTVIVTLSLVPILESLQKHEMSVFLFVFIGIIIALVLYILYTFIFNFILQRIN